MPLFITCQQCGTLKEVPSRSQQRRQRFCSRRCAGQATSPLTTEARRRGGSARGAQMRTDTLRRFASLTPYDAARQGYRVGWKRGYRAAIEQISERQRRA